jgi:hypothetical protein
VRPGFPAPVGELASGPVWLEGDLSRFMDTWERKPGRPRKVVKKAEIAQGAAKIRTATRGKGN